MSPDSTAQDSLCAEHFAELERQLLALFARAKLPRKFLYYTSSVDRELHQLSKLDDFGLKEQMPYIVCGYEKRRYGFLCVYGDIQIAKAYYLNGDEAASHDRVAHAEVFLRSLAEILNAGARIARFSSAGGFARRESMFGAQMREFARLLRIKRPAGGWKFKTEAIRAVDVEMQAFNNKQPIKKKLSHDNLDSTLKKWLKRGSPLERVFYENSRKHLAATSTALK